MSVPSRSRATRQRRVSAPQFITFRSHASARTAQEVGQKQLPLEPGVDQKSMQTALAVEIESPRSSKMVGGRERNRDRV